MFSMTLLEDCDSVAVASHLENAVRAKLIGRVRDLHLVIQENGVVLKGHTRTYYAKQLPQHAVMQESEVPILANDIEVD